MNTVIYFLMCLTTWILLTGKFDGQNLITGAAVSLITTLIFSKYFRIDARKLTHPKRYFWLLVYLLFFIWECIKANIDVAYRVLHPAMPVRPGIVKVKLTLKRALSRTILANSITMTPGTISVDIIGDSLYVHCIYLEDTNPEHYTYKISGKFEKILTKIFE
ncbi:MAG TPA: Na+/H+ antiporter subunit E [Bacteroidales bacterium]|nr:Na+/H+ antiporter subunit E [Bacteroidales bacterium]